MASTARDISSTHPIKQHIAHAMSSAAAASDACHQGFSYAVQDSSPVSEPASLISSLPTGRPLNGVSGTPHWQRTFVVACAPSTTSISSTQPPSVVCSGYDNKRHYGNDKGTQSLRHICKPAMSSHRQALTHYGGTDLRKRLRRLDVPPLHLAGRWCVESLLNESAVCLAQWEALTVQPSPPPSNLQTSGQIASLTTCLTNQDVFLPTGLLGGVRPQHKHVAGPSRAVHGHAISAH